MMHRSLYLRLALGVSTLIIGSGLQAQDAPKTSGDGAANTKEMKTDAKTPETPKADNVVPEASKAVTTASPGLS